MNVVEPVPSGRAEAAIGPHFDAALLLVYAALTAIGVVAVFSATIAQAYEQSDSLFYLRKQILYILLAVAAMLAMSMVATSVLKRLVPVILLVSMALLAIVAVPAIGMEINGSRRWLSVFGLKFQPSEFSELGIVIATAWYVAKQRSRAIGLEMDRFPVAGIAIALMASVLLMLEPDLGSAVVLCSTIFAMLYLHGMRYKHTAAIVAVSIGVLVLMILIEPYRIVRITSFWNPWTDPWGDGYQLTQSLIAFGRGELLGTGLGTSVQKLFYLPYAGSDFIIAIVAEEFGFAGIAIVLALFSILIWRIFQISWDARSVGNLFGAAMAQGIGLLIAVAAMINLGVNMGILPTKGLTLPFLSLGGTSIIAYSAAIGIVFSVQRETASCSET